MIILNQIKQPLFFFFCFIFTITVYTQNNRYYQTDTVEIHRLISLSNQFKSSNPDTAILLASRALNLSINSNYNKGIAESNYLKGVAFKNTGMKDSALKYCSKSIDSYKLIDFKNGLANGYNLAGTILRKQGLVSSALENHKESLKLFLEVSDSIGLAKTYNNIGIIFYDLAKYDSAAIYYLKLITICEEIDNSYGYIRGTINLGQVYYELKEFSKAEYYFSLSLFSSEEENDIKNTGHAYLNIGMVKFHQDKLDSAFYYFNLAQENYSKVNSISGLGWVNMNMGNVYEAKEQYDYAIIRYQEAKSKFEQIGLMAGILKVRINIAVVADKQGSLYDALKQDKLSLLMAQDMGARDEQLIILENIQNIYRKLGNSSKALEYQDKYIALKDSVFNIEKTQLITDLELKYEKEKNEAEILSLNNENLQQVLEIKNQSYRKNMYMVAGALLLIVGAFSILYFRQRLKKNKRISEEEKKLASTQSLLEGQEEERFRISKELHDGVGVMLSTATLYISNVENANPADKEFIDKANKLVNEANLDVREISQNLMPTILSTHGLSDALYDQMENIDNLPNKTGHLRVLGKTRRLSKSKEIMIYRLVQELINNTMKHAQAKEVILILDYKENDLIITFQDDGIGFDFEKELMKKSIGLKSIRSRVDYLMGTMDVASTKDDGVRFEILVPLKIKKSNK